MSLCVHAIWNLRIHGTLYILRVSLAFQAQWLDTFFTELIYMYMYMYMYIVRLINEQIRCCKES